MGKIGQLDRRICRGYHRIQRQEPIDEPDIALNDRLNGEFVDQQLSPAPFLHGGR